MDEIGIAFFKFGKDYLNAYRIIDKDRPNPMDLIWVKFFLLCRSIEHSLKAFLAIHGYSEKTLKSDFGHNLTNLLEEVTRKLNDSRGNIELEIIAEFERSPISNISPYYKAKEIEYYTKGKKVIPWLVDLYKVAQDINSKLKREIDIFRVLR